MPPKSKSQQRAAGMAYAAKKGEMPMSKLKGAAKGMAQSMTQGQAKEFATAPGGTTARLPLRVKPKKQGRLVSE